MYTQDQIDLANETDLSEFLKVQGEEIIKSGKEYKWKAHDSVCIKNNKWFQHSQNAGGYPIDFVMKFYGVSFSEAVGMLLSVTNKSIQYADMTHIDNDSNNSNNESFILPDKADNNNETIRYLTQNRFIDEKTVNNFISNNYVYQEAEHNNTIFVGFDNNMVPRYACRRSSDGKFKMDIPNSDKSYGFNIRNVDSDKLLVFEAPIDLISFLSMYYELGTYPNCVALCGVSPKALNRFLSDNKNIKEIYLCLDNDDAGNKASDQIAEILKLKYDVTRVKPYLKDWNDELIIQSTHSNYSPSVEKSKYEKKKTVPVISFKDIESKTIEWLWKPYIPKGKYVLLQGDGGIGKTTLVINIIAMLTTGRTLPSMESPLPPINVILQSAEDSYEDTIKPRLLQASADVSKVFHIDEEKLKSLVSIDDEVVKKAIIENDIELCIFDPIQAFLGEHVDMNRANEVRPILRRVSNIAKETGCTFLTIGHLNKNTSASATQRALGSTDITAAARSVLTVGRLKKDKSVRVMCQSKTNLAHEGKAIAFTIDDEKGLIFIGEMDISDNELYGTSGLTSTDEESTESKKDQARRIIINVLSETEEIESDDLKKIVLSKNIGSRTYSDAKKELTDEKMIRTFKTKDHWFVTLDKKD